MERVWKEFGKHTSAGKLLYDLYGVKFKPEEHITYPDIKPNINKTKVVKNEIKPKRNKTTEKILSKINYPEIEKKQKYPQMHKIDLIYKRKNQTEIQKDFEKIKKEIKPPTMINTTRNRQEQIEKLQDKFQNDEKKILPLKARPPKIELKEEDNEIIKLKIEFLNSKNNVKLKEQNNLLTNDNFEDEYSKLHHKIVLEIEERYKFIEEMKKLGDNSRTSLIMLEIKSRIKELRTLEKLRLKNNFE